MPVLQDPMDVRSTSARNGIGCRDGVVAESGLRRCSAKASGLQAPGVQIPPTPPRNRLAKDREMIKHLLGIDRGIWLKDEIRVFKWPHHVIEAAVALINEGPTRATIIIDNDLMY